MPKIAQEIADVNVRSHTFKLITPAETETLKVSESVHSMPRRQARELGKGHAQDLDECLTLAHG